jgi:hypothetical protein
MVCSEACLGVGEQVSLRQAQGHCTLKATQLWTPLHSPEHSSVSYTGRAQLMLRNSVNQRKCPLSDQDEIIWKSREPGGLMFIGQ